METVQETVVETTDKKSNIDKRILHLITKPFVFHGETEPRSEIIKIRDLGDNVYEKTYSSFPETDGQEPRRVKCVKLTSAMLPGGTGNMKDYFDFLLKERGYRCN